MNERKLQIPPGSPRAKLAAALLRIFKTGDGVVLREHLEVDVLKPLSAFDPTTGHLLSHADMLVVEGQKLLAKKLLALADEDAPNL